jgi:T5orf172 domain
MSVFIRADAKDGTYSYRFRIDGRTFSGSTGKTQKAEAEQVERTARESVVRTSSFCRSVIRKAHRDLPARPTASSGYVYMLRSGYFIKIGQSMEPHERLRTITTSSPMNCELLFYLRGSQQMERALHREFAACHYRGEWFFLCGKLKQFVEEFEAYDDP